VLERVEAKRYLVPLPEGGSLPAVVDVAPSGRFVVKFRGAGQGAKALVSELIAAELGLELDLPIPSPAIVRLADGFGRGEPNPEIQDLLRGSVGENFGLAYLPGALGFDAAVDLAAVDPDLAAAIVWFDAYLTNVDRTARNPNLLRWEGRLWLIDHGAALYVHHRWEGWEGRIHSPFPQIKDHVLIPRAGDLGAADARLRPRLTDDVIRRVVSDVPEEWLAGEKAFPDVAAQREAYARYLGERLRGPRAWLEEAIRAGQTR
jgi:hypothetical protein